MFMHGGLLHLGGNMLFLWIFGNNVEDSMGPVKFVALLPARRARGDRAAGRRRPGLDVPNIGASGAIAGVLGGYLLLFPRARVVTVIFIVFFFTIVELPALLILGFWFVQQVCSATSTSARPAAAAASRTSPTSAASRSGCWRSSCSPTSASSARQIEQARA